MIDCSINSDDFIFRCFANRSMSLSINRGPMVLQQLAQSRQLNSLKASICKPCTKSSSSFGFFFLSFFKKAVVSERDLSVSILSSSGDLYVIFFILLVSIKKPQATSIFFLVTASCDCQLNTGSHPFRCVVISTGSISFILFRLFNWARNSPITTMMIPIIC